MRLWIRVCRQDAPTSYPTPSELIEASKTRRVHGPHCRADNGRWQCQAGRRANKSRAKSSVISGGGCVVEGGSPESTGHELAESATGRRHNDMSGRVDGRTGGRVDRRTDRRTGRRTSGQMDKWDSRNTGNFPYIEKFQNWHPKNNNNNRRRHRRRKDSGPR